MQVRQVKQYALVLHPHEPDAGLSRQTLLEGLQKIGLAGVPLQTQGDVRESSACRNWIGDKRRLSHV